MAFAVVIGAIVQCSHGGKSRLRAGNAKLKVNDAAVVTAGMEVGVPFLPFGSPPTPDNPAPCTKQAPGTPPPPSPCTATLAATPDGVSTKITVDGIGVLLDTASGKATNTNDPDANWIISDAGQAVLRES